MTIPEIASDNLYRYINGIVKRRQSNVLAINGIGNHVHILVELSSSVSLSDMVRDIKQSSSKWMKTQPVFVQFAGWGKEYGAFSCSATNLERVKGYIKRQKEHHNVKSFEEEYKEIIELSGLKWNDYYLS
ncbi:MAG: transposase [Muribaculaceae bacterium]|nr:transposase [Muribaculaceae bacterium]